MDVTISFEKGRCFFNNFNSTNDKNRKTGKVGVNYCRYTFIGAIFNLLGITLQVHYKKNGKQLNCYVYRGSFKEWLRSHEKDPFFDRDKSCLMPGIPGRYSLFNREKNKKEKLNVQVVNKYISLISSNYEEFQEKLKKRKINPGKPLVYEKIIELGQKKFSNHPQKEKILKKVKEILANSHGISYEKWLNEGLPPYFGEGYSEYIIWSNHWKPGDKGYTKYHEVKSFLNSLPGVDTTPFQGTRPAALAVGL